MENKDKKEIDKKDEIFESPKDSNAQPKGFYSTKAGKWVAPALIFAGLSIVTTSIVLPIVLVNSNNNNNQQHTSAEQLATYVKETLVVSPSKKSLRTIEQLDALVESSFSYTSEFNAAAIQALGVESNLSTSNKPSDVKLYYRLERDYTNTGTHYTYVLHIKGIANSGLSVEKEVVVIVSEDSYLQKDVSQVELADYMNKVFNLVKNTNNPKNITELDDVVYMSQGGISFDQNEAVRMGLIAEMGEKSNKIVLTYELTVVSGVEGQNKTYRLVVTGTVANLAPVSRTFNNLVVSSDVAPHNTTSKELSDLMDEITLTADLTKTIADIEPFITESKKKFSIDVIDGIGITSNIDTKSIPTDVRFSYVLTLINAPEIEEKNDYRFTLIATTINANPATVNKTVDFKSSNNFFTTQDQINELMNSLTLVAEPTKTFAELDAIVATPPNMGNFNNQVAKAMGITSNIDTLTIPSDVDVRYTLTYTATNNAYGINKNYQLTIEMLGVNGMKATREETIFSIDATYKSQTELDTFMSTLTWASTPTKLISQLDAYVKNSVGGVNFDATAANALGIQTNLFNTNVKPKDVGFTYVLTVKDAVDGEKKTYDFALTAKTKYSTSVTATKALVLTSADRINNELDAFDSFMETLNIAPATTPNKSFNSLDVLASGSFEGAAFDVAAVASLGITSNLSTIITNKPASLVLKYKLTTLKNELGFAKEYSLVVYGESNIDGSLNNVSKESITIVSDDVFKTTQAELDNLKTQIQINAPERTKNVSAIDLHITSAETPMTLAIASAIGLDSNYDSVDVPEDIRFTYTLVKNNIQPGHHQTYTFTLFARSTIDSNISVTFDAITLTARDLVTTTQTQLNTFAQSIAFTVPSTPSKTIEELDGIVTDTVNWRGAADFATIETLFGITITHATKPDDVFITYKLVQNAGVVNNGSPKTYSLQIKVMSFNGHSALSSTTTITSSDNVTTPLFDLETFMATWNFTSFTPTKTIAQLDALVTSTSTTPAAFDTSALTDLGLVTNIPVTRANTTFAYAIVKLDVDTIGVANKYQIIVTGTLYSDSTITVSKAPYEIRSTDVRKTTAAELLAFKNSITIQAAQHPNRTIAELDVLKTTSDQTLDSTKIDALGIFVSYGNKVMPSDVHFTYSLTTKRESATFQNEYNLDVKVVTTAALSESFNTVVVKSSDRRITTQVELQEFMDSLSIQSTTPKTIAQLEALVQKSANWALFGTTAYGELGLTVNPPTHNSDIKLTYQLIRVSQTPNAKNQYRLTISASVLGSNATPLEKTLTLNSLDNYESSLNDIQNILRQFTIGLISQKTYTELDALTVASENWISFNSGAITALGITTNIDFSNIPLDTTLTYKLVKFFSEVGENVGYTLTLKLTSNEDSTVSSTRTFVIESSNNYSTSVTDLEAYMNSLTLTSDISTKTFAFLDTKISQNFRAFTLDEQTSLGLYTTYNPLTKPADINITYRIVEVAKVGGRRAEYKLILKGTIPGHSEEIELTFFSADARRSTESEIAAFMNMMTLNNHRSTEEYLNLQALVGATANWARFDADAISSLGIPEISFDMDEIPLDVIFVYKLEEVTTHSTQHVVYRLSIKAIFNIYTTTKVFYILSQDKYRTTEEDVQAMINGITLHSIRGGTLAEYDSRVTYEKQDFTKNRVQQFRMNSNFNFDNKPEDVVLTYTWTDRPKTAGQRAEYIITIYAHIAGDTVPLQSEKLVTSEDSFVDYPEEHDSFLKDFEITKTSSKTNTFLNTKRTDIRTNGTLQTSVAKTFNPATDFTLFGLTTNLPEDPIPDHVTFQYELIQHNDFFGSKAQYTFALIESFKINTRTFIIRREFPIEAVNTNYDQASFSRYAQWLFYDENEHQHSMDMYDFNAIEAEMQKEFDGWAPLNQEVAELYGFYSPEAYIWEYMPEGYELYYRTGYSSIKSPDSYTPELGTVLDWNFSVKAVRKNSNNDEGAPNEMKHEDTLWNIKNNDGLNTTYEIQAIFNLYRIFDDGDHTNSEGELTYNNYSFQVSASKPADLSDTTIDVLRKVIPGHDGSIDAYIQYCDDNAANWIGATGQFPSPTSELTFNVQEVKTEGREVFYEIIVSSKHIKNWIFQISVEYGV